VKASPHRIQKEIKRGRRTVDVLDTIVRAAFLGDQNVLAKWRNARRVQAVPGTANVGSSSEVPAVTQAQPQTSAQIALV
jgi:hypothetical protein